MGKHILKYNMGPSALHSLGLGLGLADREALLAEWKYSETFLCTASLVLFTRL